jgi:long-chain fatty acid transport protein
LHLLSIFDTSLKQYKFSCLINIIYLKGSEMRNCYLFFLIALLFSPVNASAGGFLVYNQDATANSLSLAYTAQVDTPAAVLYNPAAINQLEGTQCLTNATIITYKSDFHSYQTGKRTEQDDHIFILPSFYATKKLNDKWSVGIGSFSYYGLTTDWPNNWEGRYISTFAQLRSFFANAVLSYQITPKLSLAGGINGVYSDVKQRKNINISPLSDGRARFRGDDIGWGYNFALLYHINEKIKFGLSYRSTISMDYEGDVRFQVPKFLNKIVPEGGASLHIDLPALLDIGVCYSFSDRWSVETDMLWTEWSSYDKLDVKYQKRVPKIMEKSAAPIIRDYHNTYSYACGVSFKATDSLTLRAGYLFDPSAVPEENTDPVLPDSDKDIYSIGIEYRTKRLSMNISDYVSVYRSRNVRNNRDGLNGKYETQVNMIAFNLLFYL